MDTELTILKEALTRSISKKEPSASIAYSRSGKQYVSGNIDSDTHLLNITSEQAALALSTISTDYKVYKVVTLSNTEDAHRDISPITLKFLIDHHIRTGEIIEYTAINSKGEILCNFKDVADIFPFYKPQLIKLQRVSSSVPTSYKTKKSADEDVISCLRKHAKTAITKNFPTYDNATGYGTALITKDGSVYSAGQYSSPDHRIGFHSEPIALIAAIMDGNTNIECLGVMSSKHTTAPCNSCGICRQFMSEISIKLNLDFPIYCFASETDDYTKNTITTYLPNQWTNLK